MRHAVTIMVCNVNRGWCVGMQVAVRVQAGCRAGHAAGSSSTAAGPPVGERQRGRPRSGAAVQRAGRGRVVARATAGHSRAAVNACVTECGAVLRAVYAVWHGERARAVSREVGAVQNRKAREIEKVVREASRMRERKGRESAVWQAGAKRGAGAIRELRDIIAASALSHIGDEYFH